MSPAIPIPDDYELSAAVYELLAKASRAVVEVKEKNFTTPVRLWRFARNMREVLEACEKFGPAAFAASPRPDAEWSVDFRRLYTKTANLVATCRRAGLTNRAMTAGSVNLIARFADDFLDLAERIELVMDPRTREHFEAARKLALDGEAADFFSLMK